jgi:stage II sporulation protein D
LIRELADLSVLRLVEDEGGRVYRSFGVVLMTMALYFSAAAQEAAQQPPNPSVVEQPQTEQQQLEEEHLQFRAQSGESHASGARPELGPVVLGNPTGAVIALRVGLHTTTFTTGGAVATEFSSLHHPFVELTNTAGDVKVIDRSTGREISVMTPGALVRVEHDATQFQVTQAGVFLGAFDGPIFFQPTSALNLFRVEHIRRVFGGTHRPLYRGAMEVGRGSTTAGLPGAPRVNVWNVIEVEQYVPGVVANESIASFAIEALKAQAVAARGYAIANIGNYIRRGYQFDIVDSTASQVYRGVVSEHVNAVKAASDTYGLVASHTGRIISAMYSSSFGGHSEDNEWISFTLNRAMGGAPLPYLRGIYDGEGPPPDLTSDVEIDFFWRTNPPVPQIYDECSWTGNTFSRWRFPLSAATIKARMTDANSVLVGSTGSRTGSITDLAIIERGEASKRSVILRVTFTTGVYDVLGWEGIRAVIGRTSSPSGGLRACNSNPNLPPTSLPANFTLNNPSSIDVSKNVDGTVSQVMVYGGGWGHNLGMSQYGAHGRGKHGQLFIDILKAYYTGVDIGSYPIDIGREPGAGPPTLRQGFFAPNALGTLQIRSQGGLKGLRVHINELHDLSFDEVALASDLVSVDISSYLVQGLNVIQYNPVGRAGGATVSVVVR